MSRSPAMPMFWGDYFADTQHLTTEEHGAYLLLLGTMWMTSAGTLPDDDARLARIARCSASRWRDKLRPALEGFFVISDGTWSQSRLEKERDFVAKRSASFVERGKKGGRPKSLENNETGKATGKAELKLKESTPPIYIDTKLSTALPVAPREPALGLDRSERGEAVAVPPAVPEPVKAAVPGAYHPDHAATLKRVLALMEVADDPRWAGHGGANVDAWLKRGAGPDLICSTVRDVMERRKSRGEGPPKGLRYFDQAVMEAMRPPPSETAEQGGGNFQPSPSLDSVPAGWRRDIASEIGVPMYQRWIAGLSDPAIEGAVATLRGKLSKFQADHIRAAYHDALARILGVSIVQLEREAA